MTTPPLPPRAAPAAIFAELARAAPGKRAALVASHGDLAEVLGLLAQHIDQLMLTDLGAALESASLLSETADALGVPVARVRARRAWAQCLSYSNRFNEALAVLDEGAALAAELGQRRERALVNMTRLHALARLGRLDEAVEAGESAWHDLVEIGDPVAAAKADVNLGVVQRMRGRPAEAIIHFERALPTLRGEAMLAAQIQSNRAEALLDLHEFQGAEAAFQEALGIFQEIGAARAAAIVEGNLADLMGRQGRLALALHHFEQARRRIERDGPAGDVARLEAEAAEVQLQMGSVDEARMASAAAMRVLEEQGMTAEAARSRLTLARALASLGEVDEAQRALSQVSAQFESVGQADHARRAMLARAEVLLHQGRLADSRTLVLSVLGDLRDRPADAAQARALLAAIELEDGRADESEAQGKAGLKLAESLGLGPLLAQLLHLRGQALLQMGSAEEALESLLRAVDQVERIRGSLQADRFRTVFHARSASVYEDAVSAALGSSRADRVAMAFALVERARSRALLDLLAGILEQPSGQGDAEFGQLAQDLGRWRGTLNALYTGLHEAGGSTRPSGGGWLAEIENAERQIGRLESRLASTAALGGLYAEPLSLEQVRGHIPADSLLLEYFVANRRVLAFVVSPNGATVEDLCEIDDVAPALERLHFQIGRALARRASSPALRKSIDRELEELHRLLLAPLVEGKARRLIIAPHGLLHSIPFHALRDDAGYLLERHEFLFTPSASVLAQVGRSMGDGSRAGALLVGVPDERAPQIEDEVRTLAGIIPDSRLLFAEEASVAAVIERSNAASLVHIAAHAIFAADGPASAGVRLADGWLTSREIGAMQLQGAVVALSGCDTGRSAATAGDELLGLIRALLAAGASSVLASLWSVHDEIATELLVRAYRMWYREGAKPGGGMLAAALRQSQLELARREVHPAFWAPFFVVGTP
jgi:tetratricopeptide (TPR) repeat protein